MSASTERKNRIAAREAGTDKKTLAAREAAEKERKNRLKWTLGGVAIALLIAAILFFNSGLFYRCVPAAGVGGEKFSAAEVNYFYSTEYLNFANQYGSYASLFGLDLSTGKAGLANAQCSMLEDGTWRDYFLQGAGNDMVQIKALTDYAAANGISLDAEDRAQVEESLSGLSEAAKSYGFTSVNRYLNSLYGKGVTTGLLRQLSLTRALAAKTYDDFLASQEHSAQELEEQYQSYNGDRDLFSFALYQVQANAGEGADDAAVSAARTEAYYTAEAIAVGFQERESDEFLEELNAAVDHEVPGASATERSGVSGSSLEAAYKEWMQETGRKAGDCTMVENGDGYTVVVFLNREDNHYNTVSVRHILIKAEASEDGTYSDEAKEAARARAEEILAQWQAGEATEDSFAALANELSEDDGSNTKGGLYENIYKGQMVSEFDAFCFGGHKSGDTAVVYGESGAYAGYHVIYFVGEGDLYSEVIARNDLNSAAVEEWMNGLTADLTVEQLFGYKLVG